MLLRPKPPEVPAPKKPTQRKETRGAASHVPPCEEMKTRLTAVLLTLLLSASAAHAYGWRGHKMVGAVADARLAKKSPATAAEVSQLLDGLSLMEAATLPDDIKDWDACNKNRRPKDNGPVKGSKRVNKE